MLISKEALLKEARTYHYKPEILEKVYRLLDVFKQILAVPYLRERLVLKGGTALNLFYFDSLPRLSIDIDLNYIGHLDRDKMLAEKQPLIEATHQILMQNQLECHRSPMRHAGGKMVWFYNSVLGQRGTLELDINFMYRQPLYPKRYQTAKIKNNHDWQAPILDIHELAAGKLSALFNRNASRDLFDAHYLLTKVTLDIPKLREAFTVYLAMTKVDLLTLKPEMIECSLVDFKNRLLPLMHQRELSGNTHKLKPWVTRMVMELREKLAQILPLKENEEEFIQKIRTEGKVLPNLITNDITLADKIQSHPAILWIAKQLG